MAKPKKTPEERLDDLITACVDTLEHHEAIQMMTPTQITDLLLRLYNVKARILKAQDIEAEEEDDIDKLWAELQAEKQKDKKSKGGQKT